MRGLARERRGLERRSGLGSGRLPGLLFAALGGALAAAPASAASPAVGVWATPQEHGRVEVTDCGAGVCGRVLDGDHIRAEPDVTDRMNRDPALRGRKLKGLLIFDGLTGGPPKWKGRVYNPVDGGTYSGYVVQHGPDVLVLTGCIVWPLCQSQRWTRVR